MKALSACRGAWQSLGWRAIVHALFRLAAFSLLEVRDAGLHSVVQRFFTLNPLKTRRTVGVAPDGSVRRSKSIRLGGNLIDRGKSG
jgi:hypothetical protein